jgi:hypothetical protein
MPSLRMRLRRGVRGEGSRRSRALAAACLIAAAVACALPQPGAAYPCSAGVAVTAASPRVLASVSYEECRTPKQERSSEQAKRKPKRGNMSGLTVFVLAVAAALLIPIGRNGLPHGRDPFENEVVYDPRNSSTR